MTPLARQRHAELLELRKLRAEREARLAADSWEAGARRAGGWFFCPTHNGMYATKKVREGRITLACGCSRRAAPPNFTTTGAGKPSHKSPPVIVGNWT